MQPPTPLYVGIDLGTSGCRAAALDDTGVCVAQTAVALPAPECVGAAGREQDPELWWHAVVQVLRALCVQIPVASIQALAVAGTSATVLCCDAAGVPIGPALMYHDARAVAEAVRIAQHAPAASGAHGATSALAKILWRLTHPPTMHSTRHILHQADWIAGRLTGRFGVTDENNALKLGYDPVQRVWPEWLDTLGVPRAHLPTAVPPGTFLGHLSTVAAQTTGLASTTRVMAGTTDSIAAFLAAGAHQEGEAVTSLGSTLVLKVLSPRPLFVPAQGIYSHRLGALWLVGGASNSGGAVLRQFFSDAQLAELTPRLTPQSPTTLDYYPLPAPGERFPVNDPLMAPRLTPRPTDDAQFLQGLLEAMARIEKQGYECLQAAGAPWPVSLRTAGGGATNEAWTRIRARILGVPMVPAHHPQAACGVAWLAGHGVMSF